MGFFSFSKQAAADDRTAVGDELQQARTRARRRLIGAVLLLGVGLVGFPLLFETQPRPIPVDIPIQIPRKDGQPPLALPAPKAAAPAASAAVAAAAAAPQVITEAASEAGRDVAPPAAPAKVVTAPAAAASKPVTAVAESARAKALLDGASAKPPVVAATPAAAEDGKGRFVVQVGAFADASAARDTRMKVEKLGLRTYTQVVDTSAGKRIRVRVGPFATRDDAAKAADRMKSAGLPTALLSL